MNEITTESEKSELFFEVMMGRHTHVCERLKILLIANKYRPYDDLINIIQQEPQGK